MDMINATIIVQVGNFLLAYYALKKLLFSPAIVIVEQEQAIQNKLENQIVYQHEKVAAKEQERAVAWTAFRRSLDDTVPHTEKRVTIQVQKPLLQIPLCEPDRQQLLQQQVADSIVRMVRHDK